MYICIYYSDKCHRFKNTHNCNEYPGRGNNLRVFNSILKRINISLTVFMDKPEAFDTLDHPVLHNKLNHHEIEGTALACPPNYFTWRHHCIELDWASSSVLFLSTRFLQGYVLRPLFFSCDQAALRTLLSVRPSVRLSVCLSHLFHYVPVIASSWNFQELLPLTKVTSMQKVNVRGQRSRSQRSKLNLAVSGPYLQVEFTYDDEMVHKAWCCFEEVP